MPNTLTANETEHHSDWAELLADLVHELTARDAEIEFKNLEVHIPVTSAMDTPHAPWRLNGIVRFHVRPDGTKNGG